MGKPRLFLKAGSPMGGSPGNGSGSGSPNIVGLFNYNQAFLSNWFAGLAAQNAGTRNATVICVGDSTTAGWGGQGSAAQTNSIAYSYPAKLALLLGNGASSSWFGDKNTLIGGAGTISLPIFDARVSLGSWTQTNSSTTASTLGGSMLRASSAAGGPLALTPTNPVDTFDIYWAQNVTLGSMTAQIDSGATTPINENGAMGVNKTTVTAALGIHTLNLNWVSGLVFVVGVVAYNSTQKEISIINAGWSGSDVSATAGIGWNMNTSSSWDPLTFLRTLSADLVIIDLTINGWTAANSTGTDQANTQNIITAAQATGASVLLMTGVPSQISTAPTVQQQTWVTMVKALAVTNNCVCIDWTANFGSWVAANAAGEMFDSLHPNGFGYSVQAPLIAQILSRAATAMRAATATLIAAMTSPPSAVAPATRLNVINSHIAGLQDDGIWVNLDAMYRYDAADSQAASLNWINPQKFQMIDVGAGASFQSDRGYTGNGTTTAKSTQFQPSVSGVNYTLDSASLWYRNRTEGQVAVRDVGNQTNPQIAIVTRNGSDLISVVANETGGSTSISNTSAIGFFGAQRVSSTVKRVWKNGVQIGGDQSVVTPGIPAQPLWICGANAASFSTRQIASLYIASSLAGLEAQLAARDLAYATAVGSN